MLTSLENDDLEGIFAFSLSNRVEPFYFSKWINEQNNIEFQLIWKVKM